MDFDTSSFPSGFAGHGLLLLRVVVAVALTLCIVAGHNDVPAHAVVIGSSALMLAGLGTRWSALTALATIVLTSDWHIGPLLVMALTLVLALTGPGNLSLDARLFGRRNITLRPRDRDD